MQDVKTGRVHKHMKLPASDIEVGGGIILTDGRSVWVLPGLPNLGHILEVDLTKGTHKRRGTLPHCTAGPGPKAD